MRHPLVTVALLAGSVWLGWGAVRRFRRVVVSGDSMSPRLEDGDRVLIWKTVTVRPGDVVAAHDPRQPDRTLLKRLAKLEGDRAWLEGDNRDRSTDSRQFGPVPLSSIEGKAVYRYAPTEKAGRL